VRLYILVGKVSRHLGPGRPAQAGSKAQRAAGQSWSGVTWPGFLSVCTGFPGGGGVIQPPPPPPDHKKTPVNLPLVDELQTAFARPSCRPSFAALFRSCLKVLAICDELLPSKVGDSGGFVRLGSHHEYLRTLISSTTQPHPPIQPPIIYPPCLHAVIHVCS
jgi:hypothetical protein